MNCKKYPKVDNCENYNIGLNITSSYNTNNNKKKKQYHVSTKRKQVSELKTKKNYEHVLRYYLSINCINTPPRRLSPPLSF